MTYDAFGRPVEKNVQGTYSQILYSQLGKTAVMNGSSVLNLYIPLPGGAVYNFIPGYAFFRHKDWQGSARLSTTLSNRTARYDRAFAPFGEVYLNFGATDGNDFTGDTQDILPGNDAPGGVVGLYDTPARELHPNQGRWLSPDPAGFSIVDMGNPQTWNRYAYVTNNPLALTDPTGTDNCEEQIDGCDDQLFDAKTFGFADLLDSVLLDQSSGLDSPAMQGILEGENSVNFPVPDLFQTIWGDVLGLPTDLSCPQGLSPLCGGINPAMDATPTDADLRANALAAALGRTGVYSLSNPCTVGEFYYQSATKIGLPLSSMKGTGALTGSITSEASYPAQSLLPATSAALKPVKDVLAWTGIGWAAAKFSGFSDRISKPLQTLGNWLNDPFNNIQGMKNICNKAQSW